MPEPHTFFEVTCRTFQSRLLLRPSVELNELILGVVGRALSKYPIKLYCFVVLSNHQHLILSAPDAKTIADFMCYLNGNLAKEAGRLHHWKEKFWSRRYSAIAILDDESLINRVHYLLSHGCKEGLVARPGDWPGVHCIGALAYGHKLIGRWFARTLEYEARSHGQTIKKNQFSFTYEVALTPLPCFASLSRKEQQARWRQLISDVEIETRERLERDGRQVMGREKILSQDPHARPERSKRSPRPFCHAVEQTTIKVFKEAYEIFVAAYRQAQALLTKGDPRSLSMFPDDCYLPPLALRLSQATFSSG